MLILVLISAGKLHHFSQIMVASILADSKIFQHLHELTHLTAPCNNDEMKCLTWKTLGVWLQK
jgi:hypothetical protein